MCRLDWEHKITLARTGTSSHTQAAIMASASCMFLWLSSLKSIQLEADHEGHTA